MDVFISYRRGVASMQLAQLLYTEFQKRNITCFFDSESMHSGKFDKQIYDKIQQCSNFIVIFSRNAFDRCIEEQKNPLQKDESYNEDWFRNEIRFAIKKQKNNLAFKIIPVEMDDFNYPQFHELPLDMADIVRMHSCRYSSNYHSACVNEIINKLVDYRGENLLNSKREDQSNIFYENGGMTTQEQQRIIMDHHVVKPIVDDIFQKILVGKKNVVVFNPAIYHVESTIEKYKRFPEITKVIGFVHSEEEAQRANKEYAGYGYFMKANLENDDFADIMDEILNEYGLKSFDFVELTLILKDSKDPENKLTDISDRMSENGVIFIRELDDDLVIAYPDENGYWPKMKEILKNYPWSGNRNLGKRIFTYLHRAGAKEIFLDNRRVTTPANSSKESRKQKEELFDVYFSYIAPELEQCLKKKNDDVLQDYLAWVKANYTKMKREFTKPEAYFSSGFIFFYAIF